MASRPKVYPTIHYAPSTSNLVVETGSGKVVVEHDGASSWVGRIEDVGNVRAVDLQRTLRKASRDYPGEDSDDFEVVEQQEPGFDVEYTSSDIRFTLVNARLVLNLVVSVNEWIDDEDLLLHRVRQIAKPFLDRAGSELIDSTMLDGPSQGPWVCSVTVVPRLRGRTIGDVYRVGRDLTDLLDAASTGHLTLWSVVHLVRAGRADLVIGQEEGQWLDVKRQDYNLEQEAGKISLAQDVARFANGESGGAIIVGMRTRKLPTGEVIQAVTPVPRPRTGSRRHRQAIDNRVYPPPDGLGIYEAHMVGGVLIVIHVPPQPEEYKPFLVQGAIVDGRAEGAFISIVRRRGEESIPITAASIHATLAAGRALLRRGQLPADP
jgi:hypothetical protein